jgi:hypothetical protein
MIVIYTDDNGSNQSGGDGDENPTGERQAGGCGWGKGTALFLSLLKEGNASNRSGDGRKRLEIYPRVRLSSWYTTAVSKTLAASLALLGNRELLTLPISTPPASNMSQSAALWNSGRIGSESFLCALPNSLLSSRIQCFEAWKQKI